MGKQCGIMRVEKRGRGAVYGLQLEANRTKDEHDKTGRDFDDSDIIWDKTDDNIHLVQTENWNKEITRQIHDAGIKERKDAIVMLDGLYTASPDFFMGKTNEDIMQYFKDCLKFHIDTYCQGHPERVINAVVHFDEMTPHMQVASVPLVTDEKGAHLSAKTIMGGRADYRTRQDRFYDEVTKDRGLDRGEVRAPAERKLHTTKREWQIATQDDRLKDAQEQVKQAQKALLQAQEQERKVLSEEEAVKAVDKAHKTIFGAVKGVSYQQVQLLQEKAKCYDKEHSRAEKLLSRAKKAEAEVTDLKNAQRSEVQKAVDRAVKPLKAEIDILRHPRIDFNDMQAKAKERDELRHLHALPADEYNLVMRYPVSDREHDTHIER